MNRYENIKKEIRYNYVMFDLTDDMFYLAKAVGLCEELFKQEDFQWKKQNEKKQ